MGNCVDCLYGKREKVDNDRLCMICKTRTASRLNIFVCDVCSIQSVDVEDSYSYSII